MAEGVEVSVIDVPGHRRLVHTMIAGAIGMELVLLVVAGDEGVMPQTREHVAACELLGLRRAVVAVTKLDWVGAEVAQLAGDEARELLGDRWEAEVVCCSSRTGEGIEAVREAVRRALLALPAPRPGARARLSVDRVFSVKGAGTVITGTLIEGKIAVGAPLFVVGEAGASASAARGLHVHDHAVTLAEAPTRLALNLAGLPLEAVHRGDVITDDKSARPTKAIDVRLRAEEEIPEGILGAALRGHGPLALPHRHPAGGRRGGTGRAGCRAPGAPAERPPPKARSPLPACAFRTPWWCSAAIASCCAAPTSTARRAPCWAGARCSTPSLPGCDRARSAGRWSTPFRAATPRGRCGRSSRRRRRAPSLKRRWDRASRSRRPSCAAPRTRWSARAASVIKGTGWVNAARLLDLAASARKMVADHHKKAPLDRGLALETLRHKLAESAGPDAAAEALRIAAAGPVKGQKGDSMVIDGDVARLSSFTAATVAVEVAGALAAAERAVKEAGLKGVSENAMKDATGVSPKDVKAILAKLVRDGAAVHTGDLWFSAASVGELRAKVVAHLARTPRLTIAEFKEMSGLGRKQAIILLEQLDREGTTKREGDDCLRGSRLCERAGPVGQLFSSPPELSTGFLK